MTQITKDNIVEVLKFNGFSFIERDIGHKFRNLNNHLTILINFDGQNFLLYVVNADDTGSIATNDFDEFLAFVQKRIELKPLPEFNFRQYLLDNGFQGSSWISKGAINLYPNINNCSASNCKVNVCRYGSNSLYVDQTKENADTLIKMAKLAEELK